MDPADQACPAQHLISRVCFYTIVSQRKWLETEAGDQNWFEEPWRKNLSNHCVPGPLKESEVTDLAARVRVPAWVRDRDRV